MMKCSDKVRSLTLSAQLFEEEEDPFEALPIFCNMTELKLNVFLDSSHSTQLATLLRKCPSVSILEIAAGFTGDISQTLEPVPPCFQSQLKKIVVRHFSLSKEIFDCVALLMRKAMVLEEMVLYDYEGTMKDNHKVADLKKLPRGSKNCKISLIL